MAHRICYTLEGCNLIYLCDAEADGATEADGAAEVTAGAPPTAASTGVADTDASGVTAPDVDVSCGSTTGLDVDSTFTDESHADTRAAKRDTITNDFITIFSPNLSKR